MNFSAFWQMRQGIALVTSMLLSGCASAGSENICSDREVDGLAAWERQMVERGRYWGEFFDPNNGIDRKRKQVNEFYDSANTFYLISDYLGEKEPWTTYAEWALKVYRDGYLVPANWKAAGWRRSSHGLYQNLVRGGDVTLTELILIRDRPAFSRLREARGRGGAEHMSRAFALAAQSHIHAERAGAERKIVDGEPQLAVLVGWMGSHLYEWKSGDYRGPRENKTPRFAPFMLGITAHALIEFVEWERERGEDPNRYWLPQYPIDYGQGISEQAQAQRWPSIQAALADVAEWAIESASHTDGRPMWSKRDRAFLYQSIGTPKPAPDLNLMIAHLYGWLWKETGDPKYRDIGDEIFASGAYHGATVTGKHFNQQYRMAFDYLRWRAAGDDAYCSRDE